MVVEAVQVDVFGNVRIDGKDLVGTPFHWLVEDEHGNRTNWSDEGFRKYFIPANHDAEFYMSTQTRIAP